MRNVLVSSVFLLLLSSEVVADNQSKNSPNNQYKEATTWLAKVIHNLKGRENEPNTEAIKAWSDHQYTMTFPSRCKALITDNRIGYHEYTSNKDVSTVHELVKLEIDFASMYKVATDNAKLTLVSKYPNMAIKTNHTKTIIEVDKQRSQHKGHGETSESKDQYDIILQDAALAQRLQNGLTKVLDACHTEEPF